MASSELERVGGMLMMIKRSNRERRHQLVETGHCCQTKLRKVEKVFYQRVLLPPVHLKWDCRPLLPFVASFYTAHKLIHLLIIIIIIISIIKTDGNDFAAYTW